MKKDDDEKKRSSEKDKMEESDVIIVEEDEGREGGIGRSVKRKRRSGEEVLQDKKRQAERKKQVAEKAEQVAQEAERKLMAKKGKASGSGETERLVYSDLEEDFAGRLDPMISPLSSDPANNVYLEEVNLSTSIMPALLSAATIITGPVGIPSSCVMTASNSTPIMTPSVIDPHGPGLTAAVHHCAPLMTEGAVQAICQLTTEIEKGFRAVAAAMADRTEVEKRKVMAMEEANYLERFKGSQERSEDTDGRREGSEADRRRREHGDRRRSQEEPSAWNKGYEGQGYY
jgi:hypothetical protein